MEQYKEEDENLEYPVFVNGVGQDWRWVAKWSGTPPAIAWDFWQWQGSPLDHDRFAGTLDELRALAGLEGEMDPRVIPDVKLDCKPGGTLYLDADCTQIAYASWPGGSVVGCYGSVARPKDGKLMRALRVEFKGAITVAYYGADLCSDPGAVVPAAKHKVQITVDGAPAGCVVEV